MTPIRTFVSAALIALGLSLGGAASAEDSGPAQAIAVEVIQGQLTAMAAGDKAQAFAYAAPNIQQRSPDANTFMQMVARGYGALIAPQAYEFQRYEQREDQAVQEVQVIAKDGSVWMAQYLMQRMEDGSWRIAGCQIRELPGGAV